MRGARSGSLAPSARAMRDHITASRLRSAQLGLRPGELASPSKPDAHSRSSLAELARPVLDSVWEDLPGTRLALLLADDGGWIVDRRVDHYALESALDRLRLRPGHNWDERYVGTNALGTALECAAPIMVRGRDHFVDALTVLTCAAAPITDPRTGRVLGVVGVACSVEETSALMLPYACRVSRDIEGQLVGDASAPERALLEHFVRSRLVARGPMVSVNRRNMFVNAAAARFISPADHAVIWKYASRATSGRSHQPEELVLTSGTRLAAHCEPVVLCSETVGAMIRLVPATAVVAGSRRGGGASRPSVGWTSLTQTQLGIADLVADGLTNQEAATRLYVSRHTIDFHLRQIFNKLDVRSRVDVARIVAEHRVERRSDNADAA